MTLTGKLITLFAPLQLFLVGLSLLCFIKTPNIQNAAGTLFLLYLLPPLLWRLLHFFKPLAEGESDILAKRYNPWWAAHQLQMLYMALPFLESLLRLIPGLYSMWLRLWGSQIGKNIYWTPGVYVYDRNLLELGDHIVIGERTSFVSHYITPKDGGAVLVVKKVKVETGAFIGATCVLSPGCHIQQGAMVRAGSEFYPNSIFDQGGLKAGKIKGMPRP